MKIILQSASHIPPPYAYRLVIVLEPVNKGVQTEVSWVFTDREELSEQEILDEGFEPDGDFAWQGALPPNWLTYYQQLPNQLDLSRKAVQVGDVQISVEDNGKLLAPQMPKAWILFAQEHFQATLEMAKVEKPLHIYFRFQAPELPATCELDVSFARLAGKRKAIAQKPELEISWIDCQQLMALLFEGEETAPPVKKPTSHDMLAFSADKQLWHVYGKNYHHAENEWVGKVLGILGLK
jgi:hypothetical protein